MMEKKFKDYEDYKLFLEINDYLKTHFVSDLLYIVYESVAESEVPVEEAEEKIEIEDIIDNKIVPQNIQTLKDYVEFFREARSEEQLHDLYNAHIAITPSIKKHALIVKAANIVAKEKGYKKLKYIEKER